MNGALRSCLLIALAGTAARAETPIPAPAEPHGSVIALTGATVYTVSGPVMDGGVVLIADGKIQSVGDGVAVPAGATRIDCAGLRVYPGFISAHTRLGLTEIGAIRQQSDFQETGRINMNARAQVAINPESELIPVARANGVLTALSVPAGGLLSGLSALIHLDGWTWEDLTTKAPAALHVQWPSLAINRAKDAKPPVEEQEKEQARALRELDQLFDDARAYWTARDASGEPGAERLDHDPRWDAMGQVLRREIPVIVHAGSVRQINAALDWAERQNVRLVVSGGYDAPLVAERLREANVPVITQGILAMPARDYEPYDQAYTLPARLAAARVPFCISTGGDGWNERNLPYHAAMAMSYGLPRDEALRAITLYPARILGVEDHLGSIEVGKDATLCVWDGDPLDIRSHVVRAFIDGREIDLESKQTRLYDKYRDRHVER